jgi:hypothetical protein
MQLLQIRVTLVAIVLGLSAAALYATEISVSGATLAVKTDAMEVKGDLVKGQVSLKGAGMEFTGPGQILAVRPDGWVSPMMKGGSERRLGNDDTLVVQVQTTGGPSVVVMANPANKAATGRLPLKALGLKGKVYAAYDFAGDKLNGPITSSLLLVLPEGKPTMVAVAEAKANPVVVATPDVLANPQGAACKWDEGKKKLSGTAKLEAGKPYEIRILAPPVPASWKAEAAQVKGGKAAVKQEGEWVRVTLTAAQAGPAEWSVTFAKGAASGATAAKGSLKAEAPGPRCVSLAGSTHGMNVKLRRNDGREFVMTESTFTDTTVSPETEYTYTLQVVDWSGKARDVATAGVKTPGKPALPPLPNVYLSDLNWVKAANGWNGQPRKDKSIQDNPIRIRGEAFKRGIGAHAHAEIVYAVKPEWKRFVAVVGLDDEEKNGSIRFSVLADGKPLIKTPVLGDSDERFCINVAIPGGTKQLTLVVDDGGNGNGCDHGDWANAGFTTK